MAADDWITLSLGKVCQKIGSGATPRGGSNVYSDSGPYALIRSQNVHNDGFYHEGLAFIGEDHAEKLATVAVLEHDVLLNITGDSVARVCQVDASILPARVNQHVSIVRPDPNLLDARFLRYFLISPHTQSKLMSWAGSGGTRNALTKAMIESVEVFAPKNTDEQQAIGYLLGTFDDKIDLNRRMNETLQAIAQAIFKSWFVDFEPVHAYSKRGKLSSSEPFTDLFPDCFETSEIGPIPNGWKVGPILGVAELLSGGTPKTDREEFWGGPIMWASAKDVSQCAETFLLETERTITLEGLAQSSTQLIPACSTVVVARGATTGRMVILGREMAMNQTCYALKSKIDCPFTLHCLLRKEIDALVHAAHGSVFDTITTSTFSRSKTVIAPDSVIKAFENLIAPLFTRMLCNSDESRTLGDLRDTLLPKLISGELRIGGHDQFGERKSVQSNG